MFHVKHEGSSGSRSGEAAALRRYAELLETYAVPRGLIARGDTAHLGERHIADSLRAVPLLEPGDGRAVDLGSGAGLPGIPIAIALPELRVVLAESRRTRIAFLELVVDQLALDNVTVHGARAEALHGGFDIAFARGFADARRTWATAAPLLAGLGRLLYWAGASFDPAVDAPPDLHVDLARAAALESRGPIVIMARQ